MTGTMVAIIAKRVVLHFMVLTESIVESRDVGWVTVAAGWRCRRRSDFSQDTLVDVLCLARLCARFYVLTPS
jgi:hypothetical protein